MRLLLRAVPTGGPNSPLRSVAFAYAVWMDPLSLLVGGAVAAAGFLVGRLRTKRGSAGPVGPICDCGHPLSFHNEYSRQCHAMTLMRAADGRQKWENGRCPCQRYVGPMPLDSVWVPPIELP